MKLGDVGLSYCIYVQVIMFLSRSDEETTANRKLAKDLVDKWVGFYIIFGALYYAWPHSSFPKENHKNSRLLFC